MQVRQGVGVKLEETQARGAVPGAKDLIKQVAQTLGVLLCMGVGRRMGGKLIDPVCQDTALELARRRAGQAVDDDRAQTARRVGPQAAGIAAHRFEDVRLLRRGFGRQRHDDPVAAQAIRRAQHAKITRHAQAARDMALGHVR